MVLVAEAGVCCSSVTIAGVNIRETVQDFTTKAILGLGLPWGLTIASCKVNGTPVCGHGVFPADADVVEVGFPQVDEGVCATELRQRHDSTLGRAFSLEGRIPSCVDVGTSVPRLPLAASEGFVPAAKDCSAVFDICPFAYDVPQAWHYEIVSSASLTVGAPAHQPCEPTDAPLSRVGWAGRTLREAPGSPISLEDSHDEVEVAHARCTRAEEQDSTFAVFDVYHHARILRCKTWHTAAQLFEIACRHTPEIATGMASHRVVRHLLPGFPPSQLVLWGDILPSAVIVPVACRPGEDAVCTVEALGSYSALQLVALVCRYCLIPDGLLDLVSNLEVQVAINGYAVFPLESGTCAIEDTAQLRRHAFRQALPMLSAGSVSQGSRSSDASVRELARTITYDEDRPESFVIFAEGFEPLVQPIPHGSSLADLINIAFQQFPHSGHQMGHRILSQPILSRFASGAPLMPTRGLFSS